MSTGLWTSYAEETVALSVIRGRIMEAKEYKALWEKQIYYLDGHHLANLLGLLKELFPDEKTRDELKLLKSVANLFAFVVDERTQAYDPEPMRTVLNKNGEVDEEATASYLAWCNAVKFNQKIERAYKVSEACQVGTIKPTVRAKSNKWAVEAMSPDMFWAASDPESGTEAIAFAYEITSSDPRNKRRTVIGWTADGFYKITDATTLDSGKTKDLSSLQRVFEPDHLVQENPYEQIPVVFIYANPAVGVLLPPPTDILSTAQDTLNIDLTQLNQTKRYQSFAIPTAVGLEGDQVIGPNNFLGFNIKGDSGEAEPKFEWVTPGTDFEGVLAAINSNVEKTLQTHGISPESFFKSQTPSSGYAIKLRDSSMTKLRRKHTAYMRQVEEEVFNLLVKMAQAHPQAQPVLNLPEGSRLQIVFPDAAMPEDPLVQNQLDQADLEMGLVSKVQLYRKRHPECLSDEAAIEALQKIKEQNALFPSQSGGLPGTLSLLAPPTV